MAQLENRDHRMDQLLPVLVRIQSELDTDLSLEALASTASLSKHHFHRLFARQIGETPKRYTQRLRLERAAVRLVLHRSTILDIALDCGFHSHETFTRAFRRHFGIPPKTYRREGPVARPPEDSEPRAALPHRERDYRLSSTKLQTLEEMHLAFIRHLGPYEEVSDQLWSELSAWAERQGIPGKLVFLGIGHDAPGITPDSQLRFDAAIRVPKPFRAEGRIGHQLLPAGIFATSTHIGHYETIPRAYGEIIPRILEWKDYQLVGLPAIEIYHTTQVSADYDLNHTDIYIPIRRGDGIGR